MSVQSIQSSSHAQSPVQAQNLIEHAWQKGLQGDDTFSKLLADKSVNLMIQVSMTRTQPKIKGLDDQD